MYLKRLTIFPIKSLDGVEVSNATITSKGTLKHDREFVLMEGKNILNAKRHSTIHKLRTTFNLKEKIVTFKAPSQKKVCFSWEETKKWESFFSEYFGLPVQVQKNSQQGFPDEPRYSASLVGEKSLLEVSRWFPHLDKNIFYQRFRMNLEIAGSLSFLEDQWKDKGILKIGEVQMYVQALCSRCVVPTRDPQTGESERLFQKSFVERRRKTSPENISFHLGVYVWVPSSEEGKKIALGDSVVFCENGDHLKKNQ